MNKEKSNLIKGAVKANAFPGTGRFYRCLDCSCVFPQQSLLPLFKPRCPKCNSKNVILDPMIVS